MNIYRYAWDSDRFHSLAPQRRLPLEWVNRFKGQALSREWAPLHLVWQRADNAGDFPGFESGVPVFSARAVKVLSPLIDSCAEFLPVTVEGDDKGYFIVNLTNVVDCLDLEQADVDYGGTAFIMSIRSYAFIEDRLIGSPIFKIKDFVNSAVFVTGEFYELVEQAGLQGLLWQALP